jgi:hypothetical protein
MILLALALLPARIGEAGQICNDNKDILGFFLHFNFFSELRLQAEQESQLQFYWRSTNKREKGKRGNVFRLSAPIVTELV